jgi:hypothetical protein
MEFFYKKARYCNCKHFERRNVKLEKETSTAGVRIAAEQTNVHAIELG